MLHVRDRHFTPRSVPNSKPSAAEEFRRTLGVKGLDAFPEIVGLTQTAVAMTFEFDRDRQRGVLGIVQQLLGGPLRQWSKAAKLVDKLVGCLLKVGVRHAFGRDPPIERLLRGNALRTHDNVLGARNSDHLLQPRRTAGPRNLTELLPRPGVERRIRGDPEVAGQRQFKTDPEAITAVRDNTRLRTARRRGNIPGKPG